MTTSPSYLLDQPRPMRSVNLVKRYVFDLNEVVEDLKGTLSLTEEQTELARAWVIEHLREFHYLDVDTFPRKGREITDVSRRCPRYVDALNRSLYGLFSPMAWHTFNTEFFDLSFRHDILSVDIYD